MCGICQRFLGRGELVHVYLRTGADGSAFAHAESDSRAYACTVAHTNANS